jgi:hypothetical protein
MDRGWNWPEQIVNGSIACDGRRREGRTSHIIIGVNEVSERNEHRCQKSFDKDPLSPKALSVHLAVFTHVDFASRIMFLCRAILT